MTEQSVPRAVRPPRTFSLPPKGFTAASANSDELQQYGVSARPDKGAAPELHAFWERMHSGGYEFIVPELPLDAAGAFDPKLADPKGPGGERRHRGIVTRRGRRHRREDSRNWSGVCINPVRPNRFFYVAGGWTVPAPGVPTVLPRGADPTNCEYRSSTWVGLDGRRSDPGSSLPQIGTSQTVEVVNGRSTVRAGAWYQWWVKDRPEQHVPHEILNFPVTPGDKILATLTVQASGDVLFELKNETSRVFTSLLAGAPTGIVPRGSTAEWIMERPTQVGSTRMYPMPRYDEVVFHDCLARSAPAFGAPDTLQKLDNARLIRMYDFFEHPSRLAYISLPEQTDATTARVIYREAGA